MQGDDFPLLSETAPQLRAPKHWISKPGEEWGPEELDILNVKHVHVKDLEALNIPFESEYHPPPEFIALLSQLECQLDVHDMASVGAYYDKLAKSSHAGSVVASFCQAVIQKTGSAGDSGCASTLATSVDFVRLHALTLIRRAMYVPVAGYQLLLQPLFELPRAVLTCAMYVLYTILDAICDACNIGVDQETGKSRQFSVLNRVSATAQETQDAAPPPYTLETAFLDMLQEIYTLHLRHAAEEVRLEAYPNRARERLFHICSNHEGGHVEIGVKIGCSTQGGPSFCTKETQGTILKVREGSHMDLDRPDKDTAQKALAADFAHVFGAAIAKASKGHFIDQLPNPVFRTGLMVSIDGDVAHLHKFTYTLRYIAFFATNCVRCDDEVAEYQILENGFHLLQPTSLRDLLYVLSRWIWQAHGLASEPDRVFF